MTPQEFLDQHELTRHLKAAGLNDQQIEGVYFKRDKGDPFDAWRVRSAVDWPAALIPEMRPLAALRWLILENPRPSKNRTAALEYVQHYLSTPFLVAGQKHKQNSDAGAEKAKLEAGRRARKFCDAVEVVRKRNPNQTLTSAIKNAVREQGIAISTGWRHWVRVHPKQIATKAAD